MSGQSGIDGVLGALGGAAGGIGTLVDEVATSLTGSKELGDLAGAAVNLLTGNVPGAVVEGLDLGKDVIETSQAACAGGTGAVPASAQWSVTGQATPPRSAAEAAATAPAPGYLHHHHDYAKADDHPSSRQGLRGFAAKSDADAHRAADQAHATRSHPSHAAHVESFEGHAVRSSSSSTAGPGTDIQSILGDPSLSIEDKVSMLLSSLVDGLDGQIQDQMGALANAQGKGSGGQSAADVQQLQTRLQLLMQRRSQMLTLLSNMEGLFNQTSMQVISNIR